MTGNRPPTGGDWPIVDIIMMSDYAGPEAATTGSPTVTNSSEKFVRIHMDVNFDPKDDIEGLIKSGKLKEAYTKILAYNTVNGKPPHPRGGAMLAAAFGQ